MFLSDGPTAYTEDLTPPDTRRLVWAAPGRNAATVREFFDLLGAERCAQLTHVSADGADFIDAIVAEVCPNAVRVADVPHREVGHRGA